MTPKPVFFYASIPIIIKIHFALLNFLKASAAGHALGAGGFTRGVSKGTKGLSLANNQTKLHKKST